VSWIGLDDGILDHPKFIRAVRLGGSGVIHLWLGLRVYCAKNLTDGVIPGDMLDEVRGPKGKARADALRVLIEVGLLEQSGAGGDLAMHDYLQWSQSRDEILSHRERARERQAKSRSMSRRDSAVTTHSVTTTYPILSSPNLEEEEDNARGRVPCPPDLELTEGQRGSLLTGGMPEAVITETTLNFRAKCQDGAEERTLEQWRRSLVTACSRASNDRKKPRAGPRTGGFDVDAWVESERKKAGGS
jgi:hypothetical protein